MVLSAYAPLVGRGMPSAFALTMHRSTRGASHRAEAGRARARVRVYVRHLEGRWGGQVNAVMEA